MPHKLWHGAICVELQARAPKRCLRIGALGHESRAEWRLDQEPYPAQGPEDMAHEEALMGIVGLVGDARLVAEAVEDLQQVVVCHAAFRLDIDHVQEDIPVPWGMFISAGETCMIVPKEVGFSQKPEQRTGMRQ